MNDLLTSNLVHRAAHMQQMLASAAAFEKDPERVRGYLLEATISACSIASDDALIDALVADTDEGARRLREDPETAAQILTGGHFEFFLAKEDELLRMVGANDQLSRDLIARCREARELALREETDGLLLRAALHQLRTAVCAQQDQLASGTLSAESRGRWFGRLRGAFAVVGGCLVVAADMGSVALTLGLSAVGSGVSVALGSAVVGGGAVAVAKGAP